MELKQTFLNHAFYCVKCPSFSHCYLQFISEDKKLLHLNFHLTMNEGGEKIIEINEKYINEERDC